MKSITCAIIAIFFAVPAWATPVSQYGLRCDGGTDDAPAFNALPCDGSRLEFPGNGDCVMNESVNLNHPYCHQWSINGAIWDFSRSGLGGGAWIQLVSQPNGADGDYGNKAYPLDGVTIVGPGANTNTAGLTLHDNHLIIQGLTIHDAGVDLKLGAYSFADDISGVSLYNSRAPFICGQPGDNFDAGEQINVFGGTIFNSSAGLMNFGCEMHLTGTAIDYVGSQPIMNTGTASTSMEQGHIEVSGLSSFFIDNATYIFPGTGGCNGFTNISVRDSRILVHGSGSAAGLVQNDGAPPCGGAGPWVKLTNDVLSGFNPAIGGNNAGQVTLCGLTNLNNGGAVNNVPNQGSCP